MSQTAACLRSRLGLTLQNRGGLVYTQRQVEIREVEFRPDQFRRGFDHEVIRRDYGVCDVARFGGAR